MTIFYRMSDVLDTLTTAEGAARPLTTLCPAQRTALADGFVLDAKPTILDFDTEQGIVQLAALFEDAPLYRINAELTLDTALTSRATNETVRIALTQAFAPEILPSTLHPKDSEASVMEGGLHHPMLEYMDAAALAGLYVRFLRAVGDNNIHYDFERTILGQHVEQFTALFDGIMLGVHGKIKASLLLEHGRRPDHQPAQLLETYVADGQEHATSMAVAAGREALWAWLEADHDQLRRCREIDRLKTLLPILRTPDWVRDDIFALLKQELMKQHFADLLLPDLALAEAAPSIVRAVLANAQGQVDDCLRQLLAQTLNIDTGYSGAAKRFADLAQARRAEARHAKLI